MNLIKDCIETYTDIFRKENSQRRNSLLCQVGEVFQTKVPLLIGCIEPPIYMGEGNGLACLSGAGTMGVLPSTA